MKNKTEFNVSNRSFQATIDQKIAILRFNRDFLLRTRNLENRDRVLDYIDHIGQSRTINVLIVAGSPESKGREEFIDFFKKARAEGVDLISIHRMYNVINQLIIKIARLDKFVIYINSGYVLMSYLNMGLACDYRILADNAVIQNPCWELGMAPKGGGGYFLPRMLGRRKAYEIMSSTRDISAKEALEAGLVDETFSLHSLEENSMKLAREYADKPPHFLSGIKKMINFNFKDLSEYMEYENEILIQTIRKNDYES